MPQTRTRHVVALLVPAVLVLASSACASVVQPGFADPGRVHAPHAGATTVAVHGGGLAEVAFPGLGGGGAVRVSHQLDDAFGYGGEVFGGGGTMMVTGGQYFTPSPVVTGGARAFVDQHPSKNVLVRYGASGSATTTATSSKVSPVALVDATIAIAPMAIDLVEPYAFAGVTAGGMLIEGGPLPIAGVHAGVGVRTAIADGWHVHAGALVESRSALLPTTLMGFLSPTAIVSVGVSHTF